MSWSNAQTEAERRLSYLPLPPDGRSLEGLTVRLLAFDTDAISGGLVGGNSAQFQDMVNKAMRRLLEKRGATVEIRRLTLNETLRWKAAGENPRQMAQIVGGRK